MLDADESGSGAELLDIRRSLAALDVELKLCKLIRLLKYSPSQPRVPAGSPEGGQWTSGGGGQGEQQSEVDSGSESDSATTEEGRSASEGNIKSGASERRGRQPQRSVQGPVKTIARSPMGRVGLILEVASWAKEYAPVIWSYFDSPKSLEQLQRDVGDPAPG
jgi:hypothetical protein